MHVLQARGHRRTRSATSVHDVLPVVVLRLVEQRLDPGLREAPRARIQRLLLAPDNRLGVGVHVQVLLELLPRERVELLDARKRHVVNLVVGAVLVECRVDLAGAEHDAVNLLGGLDGAGLVGRIGNDPLEGRIARELLNRRAGEGMTEQSLGEEDDEGYTTQ